MAVGATTLQFRSILVLLVDLVVLVQEGEFLAGSQPATTRAAIVRALGGGMTN